MTTSRYQLDPTGVNPNNLIVGEEVNVNTASNTTIITKAGAYYAESLVIYDSSNPTVPLIRNTDYVCLELVEDATAKYGKEIYLIILFNNNPLISSIKISYQAVGGYYEYQTDKIQQLYDQALATNQDVSWFDLLNKPLTFTPSNHINMLEDIYGFEPVVYAIERLREVIGLTNSLGYQSLLDVINQRYSSLNKASLGLDQVNNTSDLNKPISTATQAALDLKLDKTVYNADQLVVNNKLTDIYNKLNAQEIDITAILKTLADNNLKTLSTTYTYNADGTTSTVVETYSNGTSTTNYTYLSGGKIGSISINYNSVTTTYTYTYDSNGRVSTVTTS